MRGISVVTESTPISTENILTEKFVPVPENKNTCTFCQYLMYYLQIELSEPRKESYIRESVLGACEKLPSVANEECKQFVAEYEPAVIALLAQEVDPATEYIRETVMGACNTLPKAALPECKHFLCQYGPAVIVLLIQKVDPSSVCPALGVCPSEKYGHVRSTEATAQSSCRLCLFAVEQLEAILPESKTETDIRFALSNLCELSLNLKIPCVQFVDVNSNALVEMILADLNAQEICVYLKHCKEQDTRLIRPRQRFPVQAPSGMSMPKSVPIDKYMETIAKQEFDKVKTTKKPGTLLDTDTGGDIETNEVLNQTANAHIINNDQKTVCVVCEFVVQEIDEQINGQSEIDIKQVVNPDICKRMPRNVRSDCNRFIDNYSTLLIGLLAQEIDSSLVCDELKLCPSSPKTVSPTKESAIPSVSEEDLDCSVCETIVLAVKNVMKNVNIDTNIAYIIKKSCALLPPHYSKKCHTMLKSYGSRVIHLTEEYGCNQVCQKLGICFSEHTPIVGLYNQKINQVKEESLLTKNEEYLSQSASLRSEEELADERAKNIDKSFQIIG